MLPPSSLRHSPLMPWPPTTQAEAVPAARRALLQTIEVLQPHRVLVMGEDTLEILCALIRVGCDAASELRSSEWPEPHCADMVVAIMPRGWANLEQLLGQARRALVLGGSMVVQVTGAGAEPRAQLAGLLLRRTGFAYTRVAAAAGAAILVARMAGPGSAEAAHA